MSAVNPYDNAATPTDEKVDVSNDETTEETEVEKPKGVGGFLSSIGQKTATAAKRAYSAVATNKTVKHLTKGSTWGDKEKVRITLSVVWEARLFVVGFWLTLVRFHISGCVWERQMGWRTGCVWERYLERGTTERINMESSRRCPEAGPSTHLDRLPSHTLKKLNLCAVFAL